MSDRFNYIREHVFGSILEVGCREGGNFRGIPLDALGVDIDIWKLDYSAGQIQADGAWLPFKEQSFDCAVLSEVINVCRDPIKVMQEARRVAKSMVYFTVSYELNWPPQYLPRALPEQRARALGTDLAGLEKMETIDNPMFLKGLPESVVKHIWPVRFFTTDGLAETFENLKFRYHIQLVRYDGWEFLCGWYQ